MRRTRKRELVTEMELAEVGTVDRLLISELENINTLFLVMKSHQCPIVGEKKKKKNRLSVGLIEGF